MQDIPFEVRSFIKENIHSVWQLDLLIALMNIKEPVSPSTLARHLYTGQAAVESALQKFVKHGLAGEIPGSVSMFVYAPRTEEKQRIVESTAKVYAIRRVDVINLIFSIPSNKQNMM